MTDADLLRRILGAMRPDIPMDWAGTNQTTVAALNGR